MPRIAIPDRLQGRSLRTADAHGAGLGEGRLRGPDVAHPHRGIVAFGPPPGNLLTRCIEYAPLLLPGQHFSHATAAALWGMPLPRAAESGPLHVAVLSPRTPPRRPGVRGWRVSNVRVGTVAGLPVVSAADAWRQLAVLISPDDLVAAGDALLEARHRPPTTTVLELADVIRRHSGRRGSRAARWALDCLRPGVESRRESRLRLLIVAAGLPEPVVAFPVDVGGGLVLHPDLAYPEFRLAIEYEGDHHRIDRETWFRDIERRELLAAAGWRTIRVTAADLEHPGKLIARIQRELAR